MFLLRFLADMAVATAALVAALLAVASVGLRSSPRADTFASLSPLTAAVAMVSAPLVWLAFGPSPLAVLLLGLCALAALLGIANVAPELLRLRPAARSAGPPALSVLSGNLYRANERGEDLVAAIIARDPDLVMLQEVGRRLGDRLVGLKRRYPHVAVCPHAGLVIWGKAPFAACGCRCEGAETPRGRLLTATFAAPDGMPVTVATTHLSQPYRGGAQARERAALARAVAELETRRLILAGDFNATPWSHGLRLQDAMLAPLRRWTVAWFSWPARVLRWGLDWPAPLLPIDHLYAGPGWKARLRRVRLPGSDHFAIDASFWPTAPSDQR